MEDEFYSSGDVSIHRIDYILNSPKLGYEPWQVVDGSGSRKDHCVVIFRMTADHKAELAGQWDRSRKAKSARLVRKAEAEAVTATKPKAAKPKR